MKLTDLQEARAAKKAVRKSILTEKGEQEYKFNGDFFCNNLKLVSLEGSPKIVTNDYFCGHNDLESLEGGPIKVGGSFQCDGNKSLTSLIGGPEEVHGQFDCSRTYVDSLVGSPKIVGDHFEFVDCKVKSFEGITPIVGGDVYCQGNKIESLKGIHKYLKQVGAHVGPGAIFLGRNPIKSDILGLLRIEGLGYVHLDNKAVEKIINKHIREGRDIFACQEELVNAGFEAFAQL